MYSLPLSLHHWFWVQTWHWEASSCFCWTGPSGGWVSSWSPPDASEWWFSVGAWSRHLLLRSSRRPQSLLPAGWSNKVTIWFINAKFMNFLFHDGYNYVHFTGYCWTQFAKMTDKKLKSITDFNHFHKFCDTQKLWIYSNVCMFVCLSVSLSPSPPLALSAVAAAPVTLVWLCGTLPVKS